MITRKQLAAEAAYQALSLRKRLSVRMNEAVSSIDAAEELGIEVRLIDLPSMEGMYIAAPEPAIVLSSLRPQGRRNFTCAHEIGHHVFEHGQQFDELRKSRNQGRRNDPKEFIADCFAGYFLMPKVAVDAGMARRGFKYDSLSPREVYIMASWLGVGYKTFINHLRNGLRAISDSKAENLKKFEPIDIRSQIAGFRLESNLHVVDVWWLGRAIDVEEGDYLLLPPATLCEGTGFGEAVVRRNDILVQVQTPGIFRVSGVMPLWAAFVRCYEQRFVGRACFRFEERVSE